MEPFGLSCRYLAEGLGVAASTLGRVLNRRSRVSPEMALRLSAALGRSPESWLAMQDAYDLWHAKTSVRLADIKRIAFEAIEDRGLLVKGGEVYTN